MNLEGIAHWRAQKAEEYPDDTRNAEAVELTTALAAQLRSASATPEAARFCALVDFLFADDPDDDDNKLEVVRRWDDYRSRLCFDNFPETAIEYLHALLGIACEAAPEAIYLAR